MPNDKIHHVLFVIALFFLSTTSVIAVDRYMLTTGENKGTCDDEDSPCSTLQYAMQQMLGGDTLFIEDGEYTSSSNRIWQFAVPPSGSA